MGYNISDLGGDTTASGDSWIATLDLALSNATTVSGNFDVVNFFGASTGEATNGYSFSALSDPSFGSLTFNTTNGTYTFTPNWANVQATGSDQVVSFTVTGVSGGNSDTDTVSITLLICVARGTLIETTNGEVAVENLMFGDMVRTLDGPPQPIRWIGSRKISSADLKADPSLQPVRVSAGALGENLPKRDLFLSPQHRVLLQDWRSQLLFGEGQVLAPAKSLTNDCSIRTLTDASEVEYFHILFDDHQIMFTEGLPTESFHPGEFVLGEMEDSTRSELLTLFPELCSDEGYGASARPSLRPWEAEMLPQDDKNRPSI